MSLSRRRPTFVVGDCLLYQRPEPSHTYIVGSGKFSDCRSGCCLCRMWRAISSAASVVPGMTTSNGRYTRGLMREFQGDGRYPGDGY